jgi:hypothetical protein
MQRRLFSITVNDLWSIIRQIVVILSLATLVLAPGRSVLTITSSLARYMTIDIRISLQTVCSSSMLRGWGSPYGHCIVLLNLVLGRLQLGGFLRLIKWQRLVWLRLGSIQLKRFRYGFSQEA